MLDLEQQNDHYDFNFILLFKIKVSKNVIFTTPYHLRGHYGEQNLGTLLQVGKLTLAQASQHFLCDCIQFMMQWMSTYGKEYNNITGNHRRKNSGHTIFLKTKFVDATSRFDL